MRPTPQADMRCQGIFAMLAVLTLPGVVWGQNIPPEMKWKAYPPASAPTFETKMAELITQSINSARERIGITPQEVAAPLEELHQAQQEPVQPTPTVPKP